MVVYFREELISSYLRIQGTRWFLNEDNMTLTHLTSMALEP